MRSLLFAPAHRPERFAKALASIADGVCFDLEDAVGPDEKDEARRCAVQVLRETRGASRVVMVRINALNTPWGQEDLDALAPLASRIMIPKVASPRDVAEVRAELRTGQSVWPLIESAGAPRYVWEIAQAKGVEGLLFGAFDFAADVG